MTVVLVVLDGFGLNDDPSRNALLAAPMWNWNRLLAEWPHSRLEASGEAVGLPAGQMGNSEVGHLNLGAGFRVLQDLPRISAAIADGSFFDNPALNAACTRVAERDATLHLMGLVGPGGVHAVDEHIVAMVELANRSGVAAGSRPLSRLHRWPRHAAALRRRVPSRARVAVRWASQRGERHRPVLGDGPRPPLGSDEARVRRDRPRRSASARPPRQRPSPMRTRARRATSSSSQRWSPTPRRCEPGDVVVHLNFRADRARQLTHALAQPAFDRFDRGGAGAFDVTTLTEYQAPDELPVAVAFPPLVIDSLAAHLARLGKRQLHVAETEKYAHVTYFFNGGVEEPFPGEDRILVPSNREVPTYDLAPEMSAGPITDALVEAIGRHEHDFIVANYANADMVGHTGVWSAAVEAANVLDGCLGRLSRAALGEGAALVVTADHGNIEEMRDESGAPQTKHTTSPVPFVLVSEEHARSRLRDGELADVAPTLCELLGIPPGPEMTGRSLIG